MEEKHREERRNFAQIDADLDEGMVNDSDELKAYLTAFEPTGLTEAEIKQWRRTLRLEYLTNLYENMTDEEIAQFRERRVQNVPEEMKMEYQQRLEERTQNQMDREIARKSAVEERNARKSAKSKRDGVVKERSRAFVNVPPARAKLAQTIVEPRFQAPRHLDTIVREMYVRNPKAVPLNLLAQASQMSTKPITGRTFFPPQNANPTIVHPFRTRFTPPSRPMPRYLNWADTQNIVAIRGWKLPKVRLNRATRVSTDTQGYMHEVVDQLGCGSCWVISVSGAMSDRASIWTQQPNPQLSITNILGCVSGDEDTVVGAAMYSPATAGCAGGLPMGAVEMLCQFGVTTSECIGYDRCINDPVCGASQRLGFSDSPTYLNSIIPACSDMLKSCLKCDDGKCEETLMSRDTWGLKPYPSGRPYILLTDILSIQQEIAAHGPVVATHAIYADFQYGTAAILGDGWSKTRGVYCNVQTSSSLRPYNGTRYAGTENELIGYHAVIIVGWGLERNVPDWANPGSTFDLPYWIIRNSWSTAWNPECKVNGIKMPGYCKIAFTDRVRNINTKVYLDNTDDGMAGAAIAFMPMLTRVTPDRRGESQIDEDPSMIEEAIVTDETTPSLAGAAQIDPDLTPEIDSDLTPEIDPDLTPEIDPDLTPEIDPDLTPDPDELRRYEINQPIICEEETFNINCVRLDRTSRPSNRTFYIIALVILLLIIGIIFILVFTKCRKNKP